MRDNFVFYARSYGKEWYMCIDCGYKEPHKPLVCPVCKNKPENKELHQAVRQAVEGMISRMAKKRTITDTTTVSVDARKGIYTQTEV